MSRCRRRAAHEQEPQNAGYDEQQETKRHDIDGRQEAIEAGELEEARLDNARKLDLGFDPDQQLVGQVAQGRRQRRLVDGRAQVLGHGAFQPAAKEPAHGREQEMRCKGDGSKAHQQHQRPDGHFHRLQHSRRMTGMRRRVNAVMPQCSELTLAQNSGLLRADAIKLLNRFIRRPR